jgi:DNA uptake protein ComE-like DNA-binding protein
MSKSFKNNYLHFTKKERNGTLFLLALIALLSLVPVIYRWVFPKPTIPRQELQAGITLLDSNAATTARKVYTDRSRQYDNHLYRVTGRHHVAATGSFSLFNFDPNTMDVDGWMKLGVKEKTAIGIQNYLAKGGKFREAADIRKVWGIPPALQEKLIPYVHIEKTEASGPAMPGKFPYKSGKENASTVRDVDINNGDSAAYIALPGIGIKLAARIINFRNRLGGFYSPNQVGETFGLPDSTFQKIRSYLKPSVTPVRQINLNLATEDELKLHPYIRWQLAKVIVQYRSQHGNFNAPEDLKKIMIITNEMYQKLAPYITVDE